jgi:hypothetical protein
MTQFSISKPVGKRNRTTQVANVVLDQQWILWALASIPPSEGGMKEDWPAPPLAGPPGRCTDDLANAIWKFQCFWKAKGEFHVIDGVVDPGKHTLQKLNYLVGGSAPPGPAPAPPDPKATAEANKPTATSMVQGAMGAILKYSLLGAADDPAFQAKIDAAFDHHFHLSEVTDAKDRTDKIDLIYKSYVAVLGAFANSASKWQSVSDAQATQDTSTDFPPAYASPDAFVRFTSKFRPWDPARRVGQGPLTAAMILIHECIHFVDKDAPDYAYEWQPNYDNLSPDQAVHNPSSYASFAAEIRRGIDKPRPGAGNPSL